MSRKLKKESTSQEKVDCYEITAPLLEALYNEIQILSRKKPDGTLNSSKVQVINRLLTDIKDTFKDEPDNKYLDLINDEDLPQYSDVVLVLSQYSASMKKFKDKYYGWNGIDHTWHIE